MTIIVKKKNLNNHIDYDNYKINSDINHNSKTNDNKINNTTHIIFMTITVIPQDDRVPLQEVSEQCHLLTSGLTKGVALYRMQFAFLDAGFEAVVVLTL